MLAGLLTSVCALPWKTTSHTQRYWSAHRSSARSIYIASGSTITTRWVPLKIAAYPKILIRPKLFAHTVRSAASFYDDATAATSTLEQTINTDQQLYTQARALSLSISLSPPPSRSQVFRIKPSSSLRSQNGGLVCMLR